MQAQRSRFRKCKECQSSFNGRSDKKFCSEDCRSAFHYKKNRELNQMMISVNKTLRNNYRILKKLIPSDQGELTREALLTEGFRFNYFTHLNLANQKKLFKCCYDLGYLEKSDGTIVIKQMNNE